MKITLLLIACLIGIVYSQTSCTDKNECASFASVCNGMEIHCVDRQCKCGSTSGSGGVSGSTCQHNDNCFVNGSENCDIVPNGRWKCHHDVCICESH